MKNAAIYYRAYPEEAYNEEQVLEKRKQLCLTYASAHGYAVSDRLCFDFINKVELNRVGLQRLWLLIARQKFDTLLITDLTQLSTDPPQLVGMLANLKNAGIALVTVNNPDLRLDKVTLHLASITNQETETLSLAQYVEAARTLRQQQPKLQANIELPVGVQE